MSKPSDEKAKHYEKRFCRECGEDRKHRLVRIINGSGGSQVFWQCQECLPRTAKNDVDWLKHEYVRSLGFDLEDLLVTCDMRGERCAKCNALGAELHHWAPRALFGDAANDWPISPLCKRCHREWHERVTPSLIQRRA